MIPFYYFCPTKNYKINDYGNYKMSGMRPIGL